MDRDVLNSRLAPKSKIWLVKTVSMSYCFVKGVDQGLQCVCILLIKEVQNSLSRASVRQC